MRAAWHCGSVAPIRADAALQGCAAFRIALLAPLLGAAPVKALPIWRGTGSSNPSPSSSESGPNRSLLGLETPVDVGSVAANDGLRKGFSCWLWTPMPRGFCTSRVNFARVTGGRPHQGRRAEAALPAAPSWRTPPAFAQGAGQNERAMIGSVRQKMAGGVRLD